MPDMSGRTLGKYRLIERLGRGGMAEVYRAYQPSLDRDVAIKVMHGYMVEDDEFVGRFGREAKAVASRAGIRWQLCFADALGSIAVAVQAGNVEMARRVAIGARVHAERLGQDQMAVARIH